MQASLIPNILVRFQESKGGGERRRVKRSARVFTDATNRGLRKMRTNYNHKTIK